MYMIGHNEDKKVRLAPELHERVRKAAQRESRTITAQIAVLLDKALKELEGGEAAQVRETQG